MATLEMVLMCWPRGPSTCGGTGRGIFFDSTCRRIYFGVATLLCVLAAEAQHLRDQAGGIFFPLQTTWHGAQQRLVTHAHSSPF